MSLKLELKVKETFFSVWGWRAKGLKPYRLGVTSEGITITGASEAGVFYGIQTLRKSITPVKNSTPVLASVDIKDYPRFSYRGVHLDVSRHFFAIDEVKSFIDMMALHNMNRLHWHLSDDPGMAFGNKEVSIVDGNRF